MVFQKELKKLGLKDKEASVYVACLELGPAPVQQISRKAKVVRATTYVVLDTLAERGLVTQYKEGKKTLFSAEPPRQLLRLLEKKEEEIDEQKHELEQLLPELQMIVKSGTDKPTVRYFEGREGLHAIRQEIIRYCTADDTIYNFTPSDFVNAVFPANEETFHRQRSAKKIPAKTIFTTKSVNLRKLLESRSPDDLNKRRYISPERFPSSSGITIFKDRVALGDFAGKGSGVIIDNKTIADTMRYLFELAWVASESIDK